MSKLWSREEIELIVADYRAMLTAELAGEPYSKAQHRRELQKVLHSRSEGSIEYKHQNISAVLLENGFPSLDGYKPAWNYQGGVFPEIVIDQMEEDHVFRNLAERAADEEAESVPTIEDILSIWVEPPSRRDRTPADKVRESRRKPLKTNFLAREAENRSLGEKGEKFVLNFEKARLIHAGRENLADRIEHTSVEKGDGLGYDIRSFEETGRDRLIEVKTTRYSRYTPFYISRNELAVATENPECYRLYRLFLFSYQPGLFVLDGQPEKHLELEPAQYRAIP